jgi:serine/threonine-protein kinase
MAVAVLTVLPARGQSEDEQSNGLEKEAFTLLKSRCGNCHGQDLNFPGLDFENAKSLFLDRGKGNFRFIEAGRPERSLVWEAIENDRMPKDAPPFNAREKEVLREWIVNGAIIPEKALEPRDPVHDLEVLTAIVADLERVPIKKKRELIRYFTFHHLHNDWRNVSEDRLRMTRAALSKAINSLSRSNEIVVPRAVEGSRETVYAVDIEELRWDAEMWQAILKQYPYQFTPVENAEAVQFERVKQAYGAAFFPGVTHIRGDWFVVASTDSRPDSETKRESIYDLLLNNPKSLAELEKRLGVDRKQDFDSQNGRMVRGGVIQSGVSAQNRLVDGHRMAGRSPKSWYWISYDFKRQAGRGNIVRFPLGPKKLAGNRFAGEAFEHGGSEIVYPLANGLHGYYLVDENENRIDTGPVGIVSDKLKTAGTPEIVNGLSCMACHKHGVIPFQDVVRDAVSLQGQAQQKVIDLYDTAAVNKALKESASEYLEALEIAIEPFLRKDGEVFDVKKVPEPVSAVARWYLADLDKDSVAWELGVSPETLSGAVQGNVQLRRLGMDLVMKNGGKMKRAMWTADEKGLSTFQTAIDAMGRGIP